MTRINDGILIRRNDGARFFKPKQHRSYKIIFLGRRRRMHKRNVFQNLFLSRFIGFQNVNFSFSGQSTIGYQVDFNIGSHHTKRSLSWWTTKLFTDSSLIAKQIFTSFFFLVKMKGDELRRWITCWWDFAMLRADNYLLTQ